MIGVVVAVWAVIVRFIWRRKFFARYSGVDFDADDGWRTGPAKVASNNGQTGDERAMTITGVGEGTADQAS